MQAELRYDVCCHQHRQGYVLMSVDISADSVMSTQAGLCCDVCSHQCRQGDVVMSMQAGLCCDVYISADRVML